MYYANILRTRSFSQEPIRTICRGAEWVIRGKLGSRSVFSVDFGSQKFRMRLQSARKNFGSAGIFVQRRYYEPLLEFGHRFISVNDRVIDGGANQGIFSCAFAAQVGPGGAVYAFEPQIYAVECLRENARLNKFGNIVVFNGALSDREGETYLDLGKGPVSASITNAHAASDRVLVKTYAIGELLRAGTMKQAQFIKLDVEGAELQALEGAKPMFDGNIKPAICIEANEQKLFAKICDFLALFGYKPYALDMRGDLLRFERFSPSANVFFMPAT